MKTEKNKIESFRTEVDNADNILSKLLEVDSRKDYWNFKDVPMDTGTFGELVDREIVEKTSSGYQLNNPDVVRHYINYSDDAESIQSNSRLNIFTYFQNFSDKILIKKDAYILAVSGIILIGLALRLYNLGSAPFWIDEIVQVRAAANFAQGTGFIHPTGAEYSRAWMTVGLPIAILFKILPASEFIARFPSAVVGTLIVPVAYMLGKKVIDRPSGLLLAALLSVDPWQLTWSREARMYIHFQLLFLLSILIFLHWYHNDLEWNQKPLYCLVAILPLGIITHDGFLFIGPIIIAFLTISLSAKSYMLYIRDGGIFNDEFILRHLFIIGMGIVAGVVFLSLKGVPDILLGSTPSWYGGGTSVGFFWDTLTSRYSIIGGALFFTGLIYVLSRGYSGLLVTVSFILPFLVLRYFVEWRIPRYIFHLYPLFLMISLSPISYAIKKLDFYAKNWYKSENTTTSFINSDCNLKSKSPIMQSAFLNHLISKSTIVIMILLTAQLISPVASSITFLNQNPHGTIEDRPDHRGSSQYIQAHSESSDIIISSTPGLTLWYLDRVDYTVFPRTTMVDKSGTTVDTETGATVLESENAVENLLSNGSGWIIADHRLRWYVDNSVKDTIRSESILVNSDSWEDTNLYRFGSKSVIIDGESNIWRGNIVNKTGNVYTNKNSIIALGRQKEEDKHVSWGANTGEKYGSMIVRVPVSTDNNTVIEAKIFGEKSTGRETKISISDNKKNWKPVYNAKSGWSCKRRSINTTNSSNEKIYIKIEGASSPSRLGGLVDYVKIHPNSINTTPTC